MRKLLLVLAFAGIAMAAEGPAKEEEPSFLLEKWVNFSILAAGLGYVAVKSIGPAFKAKRQAIADGMEEGQRRAEEAAARAAEIEKKMAGLQEDVEALRVEAKASMQAEADRLGAETAERIAKISRAADQEIASAAKTARQELKKTAAELALQLAQQKVAACMDESTQTALVRRFAQGLGSRRGLNQ